jgi:hypothetical protein
MSDTFSGTNFNGGGDDEGQSQHHPEIGIKRGDVSMNPVCTGGIVFFSDGNQYMGRKGKKHSGNNTYGDSGPRQVFEIGFADDKPENAALQQGVDVCQRRGVCEDVEKIVMMTGKQGGVLRQ